MTESIDLAVIGGSGLYQMTGLSQTREYNVETPFGKPSAPIIVGTLENKRIAFLARHGLGHHISPTEVNYRANIYALKSLGARRIVSISACGSLREDYRPGDIVVPNQLFDFTKARKRSFFENGMVAHISVAEPFCPTLSEQIVQAAAAAGGQVHRGGNFITIEGPRFSTRAESHLFRNWGMDIIGMTTSPEAFLAREAELCYAVMAHITDYDVWHISQEPVTVEMVIATLNHNTRLAQDALRRLVQQEDQSADCSCQSALADALITNPSVIPPETRRKLSLLLDKYLG